MFWRRPPTEPPEVILYTRQGCHLCEDAHLLLEQEQNRFPFRLQIIDVDEDSELALRFGLEVPVVSVSGRVRFRGRVTPMLLRRLLRGEQVAEEDAGG